MLDATPDCIKVVTVDGILTSMNRAGCLALNIPEDSPFGMPWLSLLPPEVHDAGQAALKKAASGQPASFSGKSLSKEGTLYWDNLLTPIVDLDGQVISILCVSRNVTQTTVLEMQLREALQREQLLAQEMRHRIKNVFSVVSGLIALAQREAQADATEFRPAILQDRLHSLARASDAVFVRDGAPENDNLPVGLAKVIGSVLAPYSHKCGIGTAEAHISPVEVTTIALFLHELATNSIKYGALGAESGSVLVDWNTQQSDIRLTWTERGGPKIHHAPTQHGFGTAMVDRVIRASRGQVERCWSPEGLIVNLTFPAYS